MAKKSDKKKPKEGQLKFEWVIDSTQEIVFEDHNGNKVKQKTAKNKPSNKTKK